MMSYFEKYIYGTTETSEEPEEDKLATEEAPLNGHRSLNGGAKAPKRLSLRASRKAEMTCGGVCLVLFNIIIFLFIGVCLTYYFLGPYAYVGPYQLKQYQVRP